MSEETEIAARLKRKIRAEGPIPFAIFMEEALYGEGGYYNRPEPPIGEDGDFVTGSSHSPFFAKATANLLRRLDESLGRKADFLEIGYGTGAHLSALVQALDEGPGRRLLGWDRVRKRLPKNIEHLDDLDRLARSPVDGVVLSYELFDALPIHRLIQQEEGLRELHVGLDETGAFFWSETVLSGSDLADLVPLPLQAGQIADLAPAWRTLYRRLAHSLRRGLLITCDYGFEAKKLLDPRVRMHGTLACYRRHQVHRDPFRNVGRQDLTAHVDFTALIEEGESVGLQTLAFTRQAPWLAALGLLDDLAERPPAERYEAMQLMDLEGMGEEIRILVQGRGIDAADLLPAELLRS